MHPRRPEITIRKRNLPHWEKEDATYFITFRLHNSVPESVVEEVEREISLALTPRLRKQQIRRWVERYLDQTFARPSLGPVNCEIVAKALTYWNGQRYRLLAWCVMPNHVHVVLRSFPSYGLAGILHSWKSFTANQINQRSHSGGPLWQREYFDRILRSEKEIDAAVRYTLANPEKAGLTSWKWVGGED